MAPQPTLPDRLKSNLVWFALGMIVCGAVGMLAISGWVDARIASGVQTELRKPEFAGTTKPGTPGAKGDVGPVGPQGTSGKTIGTVRAKKNVTGAGPCGLVCQSQTVSNFTGTCVGALVSSGTATGNYISCEQKFNPGDAITCFCARFDDLSD